MGGACSTAGGHPARAGCVRGRKEAPVRRASRVGDGAHDFAEAEGRRFRRVRALPAGAWHGEGKPSGGAVEPRNRNPVPVARVQQPDGEGRAERGSARPDGARATGGTAGRREDRRLPQGAGGARGRCERSGRESRRRGDRKGDRALRGRSAAARRGRENARRNVAVSVHAALRAGRHGARPHEDALRGNRRWPPRRSRNRTESRPRRRRPRDSRE